MSIRDAGWGLSMEVACGAANTINKLLNDWSCGVQPALSARKGAQPRLSQPNSGMIVMPRTRCDTDGIATPPARISLETEIALVCYRCKI